MYYEILNKQFTKMLYNLTLILDKAEAHAQNKKFDVEVLWNSRLAPDQFNFIRQIQITCDMAKLGAARMSGKEAPKNDDTEKTLSDLKARIQNTIGYLETFKVDDFKNADSQIITNQRWEGKTMLGKD